MTEGTVYDVEDKIGIDDPLLPSERQQARQGNRDRWRFTVFVFAFFLWWSCHWSRSWTSSRTRPTLTSEKVFIDPGHGVPDIGFPESELRNWAQYSPYIPAAPYIPPPPGCVINQVNLVCDMLSFVRGEIWSPIKIS